MLKRLLRHLSAPKRLKEILDGYKNYTFPSPTVEELAKVRAKICSQCPFDGMVKDTILKVILRDGGQDFQKTEGYFCRHCKCPLSAKIRSIRSSCPKKLW